MAFDTTTSFKPAIPQRRQRRRHVGLDVLPQVLVAVVLAQLGERRVGGGALRHAGVLQDEVEVEPAARAIVGGADDRRLVDVVGGFLFGRGQGRGGDASAP